jgi:hypothetical protein
MLKIHKKNKNINNKSTFFIFGQAGLFKILTKIPITNFHELEIRKRSIFNILERFENFIISLNNQ